MMQIVSISIEKIAKANVSLTVEDLGLCTIQLMSLNKRRFILLMAIAVNPQSIVCVPAEWQV
jgi:hypothetical protein